MEKNDDAVSLFAACGHYERTKPDATFDQATIKSFSRDFRVLPLLEQKLFEYARVRHYSLRRNQLLACRWRRYVGAGNRKRHPAKFPKVDDFHFHNYHNRYAPGQSISPTARHNRQMGVGPGVDRYGQMPIPNDMHLRI